MVNERPSTNLASSQRVIFGRRKAMMAVFSSMECGSSPSDAIETGSSTGACLDHATLLTAGVAGLSHQSEAMWGSHHEMADALSKFYHWPTSGPSFSAALRHNQLER